MEPEEHQRPDRLQAVRQERHTCDRSNFCRDGHGSGDDLQEVHQHHKVQDLPRGAQIQVLLQRYLHLYGQPVSP